MERQVLPIFPAKGSRVRVPAKGGGYLVTWVMSEAQEVEGMLKIRCAGAGWVPAAKVRIA